MVPGIHLDNYYQNENILQVLINSFLFDDENIFQQLLEGLYEEMKENSLTIGELHDVVLGSKSWNITANMVDFLKRRTQNEWQLNTPEAVDILQNITISDMGQKNFPCGKSDGHIDWTAGILLSPNYPYDYGSYVNCGWNIDIPKGTQLILRFETFDVEVCICK